MSEVKLSISIPYKQRLENLAIVFEALAKQTMQRSDFEVIVGAMEYSEEYVSLCKQFTNRINIVSVLSGADFSIPRARNLAMRQSSGEILIQMDADTLLPINSLQNLYDRHFAFGQKICVVGQVVGYGNNNDGSIESVEPQPYVMYQDALQKLVNSQGNPKDQRFIVDHVIPWAFGWTGFIALPLDIIRKHELYFDETFHGWGVDDLEWSYRICKTGTPIVLCEDVRAMHLPHIRDQSSNQKSERDNYIRFLRKWPRFDVELAYVFGDVKANAIYLDFVRELKHLNYGTLSGIIRGTINKRKVLYVGVSLNDKHQVIDDKLIQLFDNASSVEVLPLLGMALPYPDKDIDETRILPVIKSLSTTYLQALQTELTRVSKKVVSCYEYEPNE